MAFLIGPDQRLEQVCLSGSESNLYFEDGFVGKSIWDATSLQDSFGRSPWEEIEAL